MGQTDTILFKLMGIGTHQYAVIEESHKAEEEILLQVGVNAGASDEVHSISIFFELRFLSGEAPFIILETECLFDIEESTFNNLYTEDQKTFVIPKDLCLHLGTITVGTARGILYEKLKDTKFKHLLLPTVDLTQHFKDDLVLSKAEPV